MKKVLISVLVAILMIIVFSKISYGASVEQIKATINGTDIIIKLSENSSAEALVQKLQEGNITINMHDYGNFEKVGDLGFSLPTNDETITTEPGDVILYQGNQITINYDTNSWTFTRLGKVQNLSQIELKNILGSDNVTVTFSLISNQNGNTNPVNNSDSTDEANKQVTENNDKKMKIPNKLIAIQKLIEKML